MKKIIFCIFALPFSIASLSWAVPAVAAKVNIMNGIPSVSFYHNGKKQRVMRIQNQKNKITGGFSKTSRKCPPFCVQKITVAPDVRTVGELELLEFLRNKVNNRSGVLIDARTPSWYKKGTIPGSTSIPFAVFGRAANDPELKAALKKLGVRAGNTVNLSNSMHTGKDELGKPIRNFPLNFSHAKEIMLFCNGPWCGQSPRAIKGLIALGYPTNKIYYYRGGMQLWLLLGFNVTVP